MAEAKVKTVSDTVTIHTPRPERNEENFVLLSVNGKNYKIMRGVPVTVPRAVAEVWKNSEAAKDAASSFITEVESKKAD